MRRKELYKVVRILVNNVRVSVFAGGSYCREYQKDKIVEAEPGSYGIMLFETWNDASLFRPDSWRMRRIIKVQPIGRGKRVKFVSSAQSEDNLYEFYKTNHRDHDWSLIALAAPPGTICYPKVKVLE